MMAEVRGPKPLGPVSKWTPTTHGKDVKHSGKSVRPQELRRQASSQRSCFLGVETREELVWENWELGRDFTKTLVLKNIYSKLQKLHYRPPVSTFFTILFPQTIVLRPGISISLPVTFRPLQMCEYEDSIEFQGKDGSFQVCLRATIPCLSLEVPESLLLPLCAVQRSSHTTFRFRNTSKLQTCFHWECTGPFQLSPEQGLLKPGEDCCITVVFRPQEALVYQQEAFCRFGEEGKEVESCCTVLLQGIAKYPCLQLRNPDNDGEEQGNPVLHFGSVAVGCSVQKHFNIHNPSPVTASFSLTRLSNEVLLLGSEFSCNLMQGEVAPGASLRATVTYVPVAVDTVSTEYLSLSCPGALSKSLLKLTGNCIGPTVSLSSSVVDFGCVEEGGAVVRTMKLVNSSLAEAVYQWDLDCSGHSVFSVQPAAGTVQPHSHTTLKTVYRPTHPIAHHRRVPCLILHRDPVFIDLIGTCHSNLQQPAILRPKHLALNQLHRHHRLTKDPPDLSATEQDHNKQINQQEALCPSEEESDQGPDSATVTESTPMDEYYQACSGGMDPLSSCSSSPSLSPHVTVEPAELVFGHKYWSSLSRSSAFSQYVSITNHTSGKLSLVWTAAEDSPFSVSPSSFDLSPLKSTAFKVTYAPLQMNTLHGAQLECFAFYKLLQKDHQVEEQLLCPPWCVTVRVIGHSFQPDRERFIPHCSLQHPQVVFPALSVLSYRTVLFQNCGDLPLTFHLDPDQCPNPSLAASVFMVPSCGLIRPGEHQILTLRTTPTADSPEQGFSLSLQLNAAKHTQELTVFSRVEKPCVSLEGEGSLYFHPTAVGSCTQCSHQIRNLSRIPLRFQWRIPASDQEFIIVEPDAGELQPNESKAQTWTFSPLEETMYTLKPSLALWSIQTPGCEKSYIPIQVMGMGSKGFIEAENAFLDIGEILVGSCRSVEIPLVNRSLCPVSFCLTVQQALLDKELTYDPNTEPVALQLDSVRGTIASHSRMLLRSTVTPHRRAQYCWTISYETLNANGFALSPAQKMCEVRGEGAYPTLQVIDACSGGSAGGLSKVNLWNLFSLDRLNKHLLSDPSPSELTCRTPSRHSVHHPSVLTTSMLDFNFSAAPLNSDPSTVVLMLHNTGSIPVHWVFLFPEDQQIELEYWAETGEFSSTELHQMKIQDNRLFSISPRSGTLLPSQQRAVHLNYRHKFVGTDRLPVLFKLAHGREIMLNFQGVTVERDRPYLHYTSSRHAFIPVSIGVFTPPRQVYELHNGGALPVHYEVDTAPLEQLQADSFNHPVLCCHNPQGEVLPGKTATLEWTFFPLEAKTYNVDIPIHIQGGESMLMRFEGCGLDPRALGSSNQFNSTVDAQSSVPCVQRVPLPGQVAFLSEERVSLGDIPVHSRPSRILFLTNVSHTDTVLYAWELPQQKEQQVLQIHPERGSLGPGQSALFVLSLISSGCPTFCQLDVICQVTQEAAEAQYRDALRRWEEERERQKHEFTLTEKNLRDSKGPLVDKEAVAAQVRNTPLFRKYKTLPPIRASSSDTLAGTSSARLTKAERRAQREAATVRRRPEPPKPFLLHLEVTARSHGLQEYSMHFPNQLNKHYVFRPLQPKSQRSETASSNLSRPLTDPEKNIITDILTSLLWSLLDDPEFHQSLTSIASEPVPYFSQLRETTLSPPSSPFNAPSPPRHPSEQPCPTSSPSPPHSHPQRSQHTQRPSQLRGENLAQKSVQGSICRSADFVSMCEEVLLNTLQNLMKEAFLGEFVLTARPRAIPLPPLSARRDSCASRRVSGVMAEEESHRE